MQEQEKAFIQSYLAERKQEKFNQELDRVAEEARYMTTYKIPKAIIN